MPRLDDSALLALWDAAADEHPLDRALTLLEATGGGERASLAALPVAERDRRLFALRAALFGDAVTVIHRCESCDAETALSFSAAVLAGESAAGSGRFEHDGAGIGYRAPTSRDLALALSAGSPEAGRAALLAAMAETGDPAPGLLDALDRHLAARGGIETLVLAFRCASCATEARAEFDILDYLWREIAARAQRLLWDVHLLGRAYGWTTDETLALSDRRRAAHVAMVTA